MTFKKLGKETLLSSRLFESPIVDVRFKNALQIARISNKLNFGKFFYYTGGLAIFKITKLNCAFSSSMAVGKNKGLKIGGKKGAKKKVIDPFTRKDWYDIKAPSTFKVRQVGKTLVNRTQGTR